MIDPALFRSRAPELIEGLAKRGVQLDFDQFDHLDALRIGAQGRAETLRAEKNKIAAEIGALYASQKGHQTAELKARGAEISRQIEEAQRVEHQAKMDVKNFCLQVPNIPDSRVPMGQGEADNVVLRTHLVPPELSFPPLDHLTLAENLGGAKMDLAAKIAGSRFCVLAGATARMQRALEGFMLDTHAAAGYTELYVPILVNAQAMTGTGQLPKFEEDLFKTTDGRYLIPTAEVPVTNLLSGSLIDVEALPLKFCAKTPCFRSEAGSAGKDTRGLIRQHQFEKVELVRFERADCSAAAHEEMLSDAEEILRQLQLPYRVVALCGKDLGFSSAITYDLEVWLPEQKQYREISSVSNFKDFQARRMGLRAKDALGQKIPVHTLNGSGLAVGRTLVAVFENFQDENGRIWIPEVLRERMGGAQWIERSELNWGQNKAANSLSTPHKPK